MEGLDLIQYLVLIALVSALVKPVGQYMADVFEGRRTFLDPVLAPLERVTFKWMGIDATSPMNSKQYALSFLSFGLCGTLFSYLVLRSQGLWLSLVPPQLVSTVSPDLAFNTALSFSTTTTWQAYAGETTMNYVSQMFGLCTQNFMAAAAGLAVGVAFIRGMARNYSDQLGNFWQDMVRSLLWILIPISLIGSVILVAQGVPMNFNEYIHAHTVEGVAQIIPQGPVAALEFIKNLGTDGGGFFNANGAHPYENPTPFTNYLSMFAILLLPAALTYTFGTMINRTREGWMLYWVMTVIFVCGLTICHVAESSGSPFLNKLALRSNSQKSVAVVGNMEGKELRFGVCQSVLTANVTSNGATGSYNSMHDSFTPIGGMVLLVNMMLGEAVYGGLGTGLYSMVFWALICVFAAGLMVGRTPEFAGNKLGTSEVKLIMLYLLASPIAVLTLTAIAATTSQGLAGLTTNGGPHGFTELIFAYVSCNANNGQNFAGLSANSPFFNTTTSLAMFTGRFALAIPALVIAGKFAQQPIRQPTLGTLKTDTFTFALMLVATIVVVGGLNFLPALSLGPVVEQLFMVNGKTTK